ARRSRVRRRMRSVSSRAAPWLAAIAIVNDFQAFECEIVTDFVDVFAVGREKLRESAGGQNLFQRRKLAFHARENSVDQPEVTEVETGLHIDDGVGADDSRRPEDVAARLTL